VLPVVVADCPSPKFQLKFAMLVPLGETVAVKLTVFVAPLTLDVAVKLTTILPTTMTVAAGAEPPLLSVAMATAR